jgi:hypothetical protein
MLQKRIGLLFSGLAVLSLIFNAFVDSSIESNFNKIEMIIVGTVFFITSLFENRILKFIQIITMLICAFISFRLSENPYFGFAIIVMSGAITYSYGGYKTFYGIKIIISLIIIYIISFISIIGTIPVSIESFFKAFNWTCAITVSALVWWWIIKDIELKFYINIKKEIKYTRKELEDIKRSIGGCKDGD